VERWSARFSRVLRGGLNPALAAAAFVPPARNDPTPLPRDSRRLGAAAAGIRPHRAAERLDLSRPARVGSRETVVEIAWSPGGFSQLTSKCHCEHSEAILDALGDAIRKCGCA
jgi:hypothetical protein